MMKQERVEYPCRKCKYYNHPCAYKDCPKYRMWFSYQWKAIQEAVKGVKKNGNK